MAIRIEFTMVNGERYTVSEAQHYTAKVDDDGDRRVVWAKAPFADRNEALEALATLTSGSRSFECDQGVIIFTGRIVSARLMEDQNPEPRTTPVRGTCGCCGRDFEERLRFRDRPGETWSGVLERYRRDGVCPLCYNTFGFVHGNIKMWSDEIWNAFINDRLKNIEDPAALKEVEAAAQRKDPDLAGRVRHKIAELQAARKAAAEATQGH